MAKVEGMSTNLVIPEIFTEAEFRDAVINKHITVKPHNTEPLFIANYTPSAVYDKVWNRVTSACRGLIYDHDGKVVARPFAKFFNYEEHDVTFDPGALVEVTDKLDGSLGILYPVSDGYAVATRGSFHSEQAEHATQVLRSEYGDFVPHPGITYLFEIIYPENRIVLDYNGMDDLIFLAGIDTKHGFTVESDTVPWPGSKTEIYPYKTLRQALEAEPRKNAEGFVVRFLYNDTRIKLKQEDYVALHRIVTNLSEKTVWEQLCLDNDIQNLLDTVPDEWHEWLRTTSERLISAYMALSTEVMGVYFEIQDSFDGNFDRKDFALKAVKTPYAKFLFLLYDGNHDAYGKLLWKSIPYKTEKIVEDEN